MPVQMNNNRMDQTEEREKEHQTVQIMKFIAIPIWQEAFRVTVWTPNTNSFTTLRRDISRYIF